MNLVTGATGIIGSHVVLALLQNNRPVVACRQKSSNLQRVQELFACYTPHHAELFARIKWIDFDIRDLFSVEDALEEIETVYHCAGLVSFNRHHRRQLMEINHVGTRLLVDACLQKKIKAFCHVSSIAAIHNMDYVLPLNEEVFWKKSGKESGYARSKYNAEKEVWRGIEEGLNAVIVNPGVVLSPGYWNQSNAQFFDTCCKSAFFYTSGTTGYVGAGDVANVMLLLTDRRLFGNRYILVEDNYTFRAIISYIRSAFKKPPPFMQVGRVALNLSWVAHSLLSFMRGRKPALTRAVINSALNKQLYSNAKIKNTLNYSFKPVNEILEEICRKYVSDKAFSHASV